MTYLMYRATLVGAGAALLLGTGSCQLFRRGPDTAADPAPRTAPAAARVMSTTAMFSAVRARYPNWYSTLSFTGDNWRWSPTGQVTRNRWAEYVGVPGRLRIEFLPWSNQSGVLFEGGRVHTFENGQRIDSRQQQHPLLLLTADVYVQSPAEAVATLRSLGVNTERFRETTWQRRRIYVIGAERGDTSTTQVWFDAAMLVPVRWIQREVRDGRASIGDTRLLNYRRVGGYPVPHEILGFRDGRRALREVYTNVRVNPRLSPQLFDPNRWRDAPRPSR